jgi:hypothetical protein
MPTTSVSVQHRPVRIGFLIRPGETADLQKAAGICTLLWGGIRNPLIPIASPTDNAAIRLISLFEIDVLYAVEHSEAIKGFLESHPFVRSPRMSAREIFVEDWRTHKNRIAYLDANHIVEKFWMEEFKNAPPDKASSCTLVTWDQSDRLNDAFSVIYGYYPTDRNLLEDFRTAFLKGLRAKQAAISIGGEVPAELAAAISPLQLTTLALTGYGGSFRDGDGIYLGDPRDFADLVSFWNLRAAGSAIEFASLPNIDRFENLIRAHFLRLDEQPSSSPNIEDHIVISFRNNEADVIKTLEAFPTKKPKLIARCSEHTWNGMNIRPKRFCFDWQPADAARRTVWRRDGIIGVQHSVP